MQDSIRNKHLSLELHLLVQLFHQFFRELAAGIERSPAYLVWIETSRLIKRLLQQQVLESLALKALAVMPSYASPVQCNSPNMVERLRCLINSNKLQLPKHRWTANALQTTPKQSDARTASPPKYGWVKKGANIFQTDDQVTFAGARVTSIH